MIANQVKKALLSGQVQAGVQHAQLRSPEIPRLLKATGFDWFWLDAEHGGFGQETIQDVCRAAELCGICPIVRVADMQYSLVARALDCGAQGIIFPRVESPDLLEKAVTWTHFPAHGMRGYGLGPFQTNWENAGPQDVVAHMNENILVILQIETKTAVDRREELLAVPGIDAVLVGPMDLSVSLGVPGQMEHPDQEAAIQSVLESCQRRNIVPGIHTRTEALTRKWRDRGMTLISASNEIGLLYAGAKALASGLKS